MVGLVLKDAIMDSPLTEFQSYKCERCGYEYKKKQDYPAHLCNRCKTFIAKQVWKIVLQLQPPLSTPIEPQV